MAELLILVILLVMLAVPLSLCATVQYCVHAGRDLGFGKLLLFSWSLAVVFIPFSFYYSVVLAASLLAAEDRAGATELFTVSAFYLFLGWSVCSLLYGRPLVPRLSGRELDLP